VRLHRILFIFKDINLPKITLTVDLAPTYVKKKGFEKRKGPYFVWRLNQPHRKIRFPKTSERSTTKLNGSLWHL